MGFNSVFKGLSLYVTLLKIIAIKNPGIDLHKTTSISFSVTAGQNGTVMFPFGAKKALKSTLK